MGDDTHALASGVVLILAHPDDPVTSGFARYAEARGLSIWQPSCIEELGWSFNLEQSISHAVVEDRARNVVIPAAELAGIWFQSLPPLVSLQTLDERDQRYVASELRSSIQMVWNDARIPVVGQPMPGSPSGIFDFGLESRVLLRRLALPTLVDRIGTLSSLHLELSGVAPDCIRIHRMDGINSGWLSELSPGNESDVSIPDDEIVVATVMDRRASLVTLHVDSNVLLVEIDEQGRAHLADGNAQSPEIERLARKLFERTGTRAGVLYLGLQDGAWRIARATLQFPYWLADLTGLWLNPRLFELFAGECVDRKRDGGR